MRPAVHAMTGTRSGCSRGRTGLSSCREQASAASTTAGPRTDAYRPSIWKRSTSIHTAVAGRQQSSTGTPSAARTTGPGEPRSRSPGSCGRSSAAGRSTSPLASQGRSCGGQISAHRSVAGGSAWPNGHWRSRTRRRRTCLRINVTSGRPLCTRSRRARRFSLTDRPGLLVTAWLDWSGAFEGQANERAGVRPHPDRPGRVTAR
jgi:hypothetical protein